MTESGRGGTTDLGQAMTSKDTKESQKSPSVEANYKERDQGIIEAFSLSEHDVLTTSEIEDHVSIKKRQLRRRLPDLAEDGPLAMRETPSGNIYWIEEEVAEPITVKYPLLRYVRNNVSVLYVVVGSIIGIAAVLFLTGTTFLMRYEISLSVISHDQLFVIGFLGSFFGGVIILLGVILGGIQAVIRHFTD